MDKTDATKGIEDRAVGAGQQRRISVRVTAFGLAACAIALLLWSRLILVTNHPRTAIAEPMAERAGSAGSGVDDRTKDASPKSVASDLAQGQGGE